MLEDTRASSNKVSWAEISKSAIILQFLDNPKLSKILMDKKRLVASIKAKHAILNKYNAKFGGGISRSITTKEKGELTSHI